MNLFRQLESFLANDNSLEGVIPTALLSLPSLQRIELQNNLSNEAQLYHAVNPKL